jgi:hypothetical protein
LRRSRWLALPKAAIARTWALILRSTGLRYSRPPITPPTLSAVVDSSSQITVTASGAASTLGSITGYRWRRNGALVNGGTPSASPLVSSGLTAATAFQFTATAIDSAGNESALSAAVSATTASSGDTTAPTVPGNHNMSVINTTTLRSVWTGSTDAGGSGLAGYLVERGPSVAGPFTQVTPLPITAATFDHTGLAAATTYFSRVRAIDNAGNASGYSAISSATTSAAQAGSVSPAMTVEYVDGAGVFRSVAVAANGSTVISGIAPFLVHFDARASRGVLGNNNTEAGAFYNLGYRLNYGENRGTIWPYPLAPLRPGQNNSRDEDIGPPIFGHVYEVVGSHQTRLRVQDTNGAEATMALTVNVAAPPAVTIIEPSVSSWPTPISGTHYGLRAGQNYSGLGMWNLRRCHNVLISKVGVGADPIMSASWGVEPVAELTATRERARHVRLLNIDCTHAMTGIYGPLHCGIVNGRVRRITQENSRAIYQNSGTNATQRAQIMWPRGWFMYNSGLWNEAGINPVYLAIVDHYRGWHMQGCELRMPLGGVGSHILRTTQHASAWRNIQIACTSTVPYVSRVKMQAVGAYRWPADNELIGPLTGAGTDWHQYANSYNVLHSVQFGGPGDVPPTGTSFSAAPQNGDAGQPLELHEFVTIENCTDTRPQGPTSLDGPTAVRGGANMGARGLREASGWPWDIAFVNFGLARIPTDSRGPYITEIDSTRPTPSAF